MAEAIDRFAVGPASYPPVRPLCCKTGQLPVGKEKAHEKCALSWCGVGIGLGR